MFLPFNTFFYNLLRPYCTNLKPNHEAVIMSSSFVYYVYANALGGALLTFKPQINATVVRRNIRFTRQCVLTEKGC